MEKKNIDINLIKEAITTIRRIHPRSVVAIKLESLLSVPNLFTVGQKIARRNDLKRVYEITDKNEAYYILRDLRTGQTKYFEELVLKDSFTIA